ncbi:hypothetical protein [Janthinobacterium sp. B9-8]|uniref:hypothetical protein n=1 Tax=Janthinobacterium sp. B9-8 TaxID=1236179 RepID=UPI00061D3A8A|nr:hypothetical protein [Janthinobacterium sp. B9-8]AMC35239.1 hypothetical protein VN23_11760 [Janthinobacterium sp. B9-8]
MKANNISLWLRVTTSSLALASFTHAAEVVKTCRLDPKTQISIVRDAKVYDTHVYYLIGKDRKKLPLFGNVENSRGSSLHIACVGKKARALVISGEFTANALQGIVFSYDADANKIERLDFAEKSRPNWLYLGAKEHLLIINTNGLGDSDKKYTIYRYTRKSTGDATIENTNQLPSTVAFDANTLYREDLK